MLSHEPFDNLISAIAVEYARRYGCSIADLKQSVLVEFYSPNFQTNLGELEDNPGQREAYVRRMAQRTADREGLAEKAQREGFDVSDVVRYGTAQVNGLLDHFFVWELDGSLPAGERQPGKSTTLLNERGTSLAEMCDVSRAFDQLGWEAQQLLLAVYSNGDDPWQAAADQFDCSVTAVKERHRRVVGKMCRWLNEYRTVATREHDGPGARKAVSNTQAQWRTERAA